MSKRYESRINDIVRRHVVQLVEHELNDPRVRNAGITITGVEVTSDNRYARVFYSLIGDEALRAEAQRGLDSAAGWVSRELAKRLRTRHTPHVTFEFDPSLEYGDRISRLLDEIKAREAAQQPPPPAAEASTAETS
ncbi:MAG: 30S ribosome-binding factor RbfA [Thermoflexales bacterium]|nr:30S ribosome-binding factor RbfA [Thermoflexales bacterium]MCS7325110.1 30S ribosome-binding factor RbfA [Thermoflexales bacterium]MCX7938699.1 30S ribosome-binding factor RbfA [Thermoflexales bacterium]MDW8054808.1 30S ribosome-binding factor RbfA [Anaerolineae bacterium]MDW8292926.1 30S ribosome-binding factor RbfA [Anaerolineae bacterium]